MSFFPSADRVGTLNGTNTAFPESIFLLDSRFNVIGLRKADDYTGPEIRQGDAFFERFPVAQLEMRELRRVMNCVNETSLLMWAGNRPVLIVCAFYGITQTLLAVLPEGPIRQLLSYPAGYENKLGAVLGATVTFSLGAMSRRHPPTVEGLNMISSWLKRIHMPFFYDDILYREYDAAVAVLGVRLMQLALLCGCRIRYSFERMSIQHTDLRYLELFIPTLLSVLLAARRADPDQLIEIVCEDIVGNTSTICTVSFTVSDPKDPLRELEPLRQLAMLRDRQFSATRHPERPLQVHCRFLTHVPAFSVQGTKQPDVRDIYSESARASGAHPIDPTREPDEEDIRKIQESVVIYDLPPELSK